MLTSIAGKLVSRRQKLSRMQQFILHATFAGKAFGPQMAGTINPMLYLLLKVQRGEMLAVVVFWGVLEWSSSACASGK